MDKTTVYLRQMLACCKKVQQYSKDKSYSERLDDLMLQDACIKNIEEIGEKASKISVDFRQSHPEIRWNAIIGTRNHLVHDYEGVDMTILWEIVDRDLPELAVQLEAIVSDS